VRSAHLVCDDGVTAELILGAILDAGVPVDALQHAVAACSPDVYLHSERTYLREVLGTTVDLVEGAASVRIHRGADLIEQIAKADVPPPVRERAEAIAARLLSAESEAHGAPAAEVHLHELGRPKAAARIIAISQGLELLDIRRLTVGPVAVGSGTVHIAHGRMSVPVPAVLHLLTGFEVIGGTASGELTTPSGAAVLAGLAEPAATVPRMMLERHGRGGRVDRTTGSVHVLTMLVGAG
jgi:pyridinium-3,5-bisthiocarboxylic acid mononucleotide nickel chelatase